MKLNKAMSKSRRPLSFFSSFKKRSSRLLDEISEADKRHIDAFFDRNFYRQELERAKVSGRPNLRHFLEIGWRHGLNPSDKFDTDFYIGLNPDVRDAGINPLIHFVLSGQSEGRLAKAPEGYVPVKISGREEIQHQKFLLDKEFDRDFYLAENTDVASAGIDPLEHYLMVGWREGRDPNARFDTAFYLDEYPDIRANDLHPFVHYLAFGRNEGRFASAVDSIQIPVNPSAELVPDPSLRALIDKALEESIAKASPPNDVDPTSLDIHWVIPAFGIGGGGHMTIFRFVRFLELQGHTCTVWLQGGGDFETMDEAYARCVQYYQTVRAQFRLLTSEFFEVSGDALIATSYATTFPVEQHTGFLSKFYFVQDHEKEFYPTGSKGILAEASYRFGLHCLCASPWLRQKMRDQYGRQATAFYLAASSEYKLDPLAIEERFKKLETASGAPRIAVYARTHTERRCVELALAALEILAARGVEFEVDFFGSQKLPFKSTPFVARNHGVVTPTELGHLYQECDIGLCFSGTNYSLVPQEMMSCGLPLVELDTASTRAIFPDDVVTYAGPMPADIADAVGAFLADSTARTQQARTAYTWVNRFSWDKSGKIVEQAIVKDVTTEAKVVAKVDHHSTDYDVDICIPTWNGLSDVQKLVPLLQQQRTDYRFKIWVCDSSSTDGTAEWLREQSGIHVLEIPQSEFQHGRTRNFLAAQGSGRFIAFLTQDAMPSDEFWLHNLVCILDHFPNMAGVFGRHEPYEHHSIFRKKEIIEHFQVHDGHGVYLSMHTDTPKWESGDQGWRQTLHYYSDNSSCMRRSVWSEIPYPEIEYGEDQVWAKQIIEAGYQKGYAPASVVIHSHDFDVEGTLKRCETEGRFFKEFFGYSLAPSDEQEARAYISDYSNYVRKVGEEYALGASELEEELNIKIATLKGWHRGDRGADLNCSNFLDK